VVKPAAAHRQRWAERNVTDPDSRLMKGGQGWVYGYNGQIAVAENGLIVAAALSQAAGDAHQLVPLIEAAQANLRRAGSRGRIRTVLADTGYWSEANVAAVEAMAGPRLLIAPNRSSQRRPGSTWPIGPGLVRMRRRLAQPGPKALYRRRGAIVEPVFGQTKEGRGVRRFRRRGLAACAGEWQLICATHNLLKLWRHGRRPAPPAPSLRPFVH
jgi:hypothetical protein